MPGKTTVPLLGQMLSLKIYHFFPQHRQFPVFIFNAFIADTSRENEIPPAMREVTFKCMFLFEPEGAKIFSENETYPRALLHWTRAAAQGESALTSSVCHLLYSCFPLNMLVRLMGYSQLPSAV